ncbi:MAG: T9SS type A sorting domain-containing protein, partial [Mameliella sp.]|nr:T9SS type A sorting domain-containing protein [Phaeodactylibacter sp.]
DLIVTQWSTPGTRAYQVLLNDGNATFTVAPLTSLPQANFTQGTGIHANDFNGDGMPDLYLANYNQQDFLFFSQVASAVSETEGIAEASFVVFPNPVREVLHFSTQYEGQIRIFNAAGQLCWSGRLPADLQVDVAQWASGKYYVQYNDRAGESRSRSFIKE